MNYHDHFAGAAKPVEVCIVGTGGFGRSFLAQSLHVPLMETRIAVDIDVDTAAAALRSVGLDDVAECCNRDEASAAWNSGRPIAAGDLQHVVHLPFDVLVEATGHPEAGAGHAQLAIAAGKHVALVSKEVDSVVGPGLAKMAAGNGRVVTPVDGDQPSLLIGLVTWAEILGFEIICAGKSSEYDFVFDPATETLTSNGISVPAPGFAGHFELGGRDVAELVAARSAAASKLPQRAVPDLCELAVVSHSVNVSPDRPELHCPIARISEVPTFFSTRTDGGLLNGERRMDVFHCLRLPGEVSFAGGVFIVVRCEDEVSWELLAGKGHVISRNGTTAMIYLPRHLLGLEAATSVLEAAVNGRSSGAREPQPRFDLIAIADADLDAGTILTAVGHHHAIKDISSALVPARPLESEQPAPFYLVANRRLVRPVKAGSAVRLGDVTAEDSRLLELRRRQDAHFFPSTGQARVSLRAV
ncbi:NAD(P)H-dependent oxidoreductase [Phyllobacterium endophyticum]|uniref:Flagellar biosynthesis protein FlgA n=1 Tax=Phyllobacterium endophyticum TaxID=1149773 RepID=A0A2P7ASU5_9HYPH|nr:flagellar biosynthesis protein FlgA [Phyllobacterium endophyticum]MBB3236615.1 putative homoserine dehydrogenase-like protein [Phyllobacterium endophyticum]PSH57260.1 flagellar biosynthesis protein FlgA [Phyllobacterium endophyticum]TYR39609.1 flagellar biosynthesis protein FlgA [Phyllobacterium endophyticum]